MAPRLIHYMPQERAAALRSVAMCGQRCDTGYSTRLDAVSCPECLLIGASAAHNPMNSSLAALMSLDEGGSSRLAEPDRTTDGAARRLQGLSKLSQARGDDREKDERDRHVADEETIVLVEPLSKTAV